MEGTRSLAAALKSLAEIYAAPDDDQRLLLEYRIFEPYFYTELAAESQLDLAGGALC